MRYSPVRHSTPGASSIVSVRLACVKHAASVQSEPESNSSVLFLTQTVILNSKFTFECFVFFLPPSSTPFSIKPGSYGNKTPAQTIFSLVIDPDVSGSFRSPAPWQGAHYSFHNPTRNPPFPKSNNFLHYRLFLLKLFLALNTSGLRLRLENLPQTEFLMDVALQIVLDFRVL